MSEDRKLIGEWKGNVITKNKNKNIHIKIFKVPDQRNKITITGVTGVSGLRINGSHSLINVKKIFYDEKSIGWVFDPVKQCGVRITYQNRGGYQDSGIHTFNDSIDLFSKDENKIDKLIKFLQKYITKKGKKTKRTKRKKSRGGGKKLSQSEFKKLISEKEKEYWDEMEKCNRKCNTIKTNYAKNKKNLKKKSKCYQKCNDKRLKNIQSVHKKYPKEYKTFIKNLG